MKTVTTFPRKVREIENAWIILADGCRLAARIWLPEDAGDDPVPAILEYLPYRKRDGTIDRDALTHPYLAGHGYACVRVDMRGNGESDGLMWDEYLKQEQDDALEVIDWIAAQPWCTGKIGMVGISWGGFNGLQVAARRPKPLKAVVTLCSTDDRYADDIHYMGGCLLGENLGWASTMFCYSSRPPDPALVSNRWREMWMERLENTPLLVANWLEHQRRDDFWKHGSICEDYGAIEAAVYAVGGWGDGYSNAVPRLLANLKCPKKGLVGPWVHKYPHFAVPEPRIGFLQEMLRWWDQWLKGIDTGIMDEPEYRAYLQESERPAAYYARREGRWIAEPGWPSSNIREQSWALNAEGLAPKPAPEQALVVASPQTTGLAGGEWCPIWLGPESPTDQRPDDSGSLCFDSAPLPERLEIFGAPVVELELASDKPQGVIAVRLCEVFPDGASARISFGVLNLSHRESHERPAAMVPGQRVRVRVQMNDIAHAFAPGSRLRVAVSTAYWPMIWPSVEPVTLTLFTGASRLALPVRPPRPESLPDFPPSEAAPPQQSESIRKSANSRRIEQDLATGETTLRIVDDFGARRIKPHGLEVGMTARETYSIKPDDPLSAKAETHWTMTIGRDDWRVRTETYTTQWADRENFFIRAEMEAFEGETRVFHRAWDRKIPRDNV
jgi:hypothetical protein